MRVIVNFNLCESNALCVEDCPEVFEIRDDDQWRAKQPFGQRLTASALALPMAIRYGYPAWPRRRDLTQR